MVKIHVTRPERFSELSAKEKRKIRKFEKRYLIALLERFPITTAIKLTEIAISVQTRYTIAYREDVGNEW